MSSKFVLDDKEDWEEQEGEEIGNSQDDTGRFWPHSWGQNQLARRVECPFKEAYEEVNYNSSYSLHSNDFYIDMNDVNSIWVSFYLREERVF